MLKRLYPSLIVSACCVGLFASHAAAADKIIWVASSGRDTADCSDPKYPCRTISAAIDQVIEDGEVDVLDRGPFPAFLVTKSVRIVSRSAVRPVIQGALNIFNDQFHSVVTVKAPATEFLMQGFAIVGSKDNSAGIVSRGVANATLKDIDIDGIANYPVALFFGGANGNAKAPANFLIENVVSARGTPEGYPDRQGVGVSPGIFIVFTTNNSTPTAANRVTIRNVSIANYAHCFSFDSVNEAGSTVLGHSVIDVFNSSFDNCPSIAIHIGTVTSKGEVALNLVDTKITNSFEGVDTIGAGSTGPVVTLFNVIIAGNKTGLLTNKPVISYGNNAIFNNSFIKDQGGINLVKQD